MTWLETSTGHPRAADKMARRWLDVRKSMEAVQALAGAEVSLGRVQRARTLVDSVRAIDPEWPGLDMTSAQVALAAGDVPAAVVALKKATRAKIPAVRLGAMQALGFSVYPYEGRYRDALAIADSAIARVSSHGDTSAIAPIILQRAFVQYWQTQDPEAVARAAREVMRMPDANLEAETWQMLAAAWCVAGDSTRANAVWDEHCGNASRQQRTMYRIIVLATNGRCAEAASQIEQVAGTAGWPEAGMRVATGFCQIKEGNFSGVVVLLESVVKKTPIAFANAGVIPIAYYLPGKAYEGLGRTADATRAYEAMLTLWKDGDQEPPLRVDAEGRLHRLREIESM